MKVTAFVPPWNRFQQIVQQFTFAEGWVIQTSPNIMVDGILLKIYAPSGECCSQCFPTDHLGSMADGELFEVISITLREMIFKILHAEVDRHLRYTGEPIASGAST